MGWQDDPVVSSKPAWMQDPVVGATTTDAAPVRQPTGFVDEMKNVGNQLGRAAMLGVKGVNDSVMGLATLPLNAAVQAKNIVAGGNTATPGDMWQGYSDSTVAPPQNFGERVLKEGAGFLAGNKIPIPGVSPVASAPLGQARDSANIAREAGYVLPPKNALANALLGQKQLSADATAKNVPKMGENIMDMFGAPKGIEPTHEAMDAIRNKAGEAYDAIASIGKGGKALLTGGIDYASLVDNIKSLRSDASAYYRQLSSNYSKDVADKADALWNEAQKQDDILQKLLSQKGDSQLFDNYIQARKTIAQTHEVDKAIVESKGELKPGQFGASYAKEKPLSDALYDAGRSVESNPAAFTTKSKLGPFNALDTALVTSGVALPQFIHNPTLALSVGGAGLARALARKAALSPVFQQPQYMSDAQKKAALATALLRGAQGAAGQQE